MGRLPKALQLLAFSVIGWPMIWLAAIILGALWPKYEFLAHTLSPLGSSVAPFSYLMNAIFVIDGLLLVISGVKLNQILERNFFGLGVGHFLSLSGLLLVVMAFVPGGKVIGLEAPTQLAHEIIASSLIVSFILGSLLFIWQVYDIAEWRNTVIAVIILTVLKIIFYTLSVVVLLFSGTLSELPGLFQKLGLFMEGTWIILIATKLYMVQRTQHH